MNELVGFSVFDFSVGVPSVSITPNGLTFNRSVAMKMDYPEYVILLINADTKQIAIQACNKDTQKAVAFYRQRKKTVQSVRLNNRELLNNISQMMGWDLKQIQHRVEGRMLTQGNAMVFDLSTAKDM